MQSFKIVFAILALSACFLNTADAQATTGMIKKKAVTVAPVAQTETFQVLGNCRMCKRAIEKTATQTGATSANWDKEKDLLTVSFDPATTSVDAIQKAVAMSGYDNAGFKAPDDVYNNLHGCCQYDRSGAPGSAKPCGIMEGEGAKN
ncbi:MAG: copper chaperone [Thermoanaerobaculia bacterium]|nr:copper chaperone [Thermoanaerobaculia bacterium]